MKYTVRLMVDNGERPYHGQDCYDFERWDQATNFARVWEQRANDHMADIIRNPIDDNDSPKLFCGPWF